MITVEIFDDGSAIKTYSCPSGKNSTSPMKAAEVQAKLEAPCLSSPLGCGGCLTCAVKAAQVERDHQIVRQAAREVYRAYHNDEDIMIYDDAKVEAVDGEEGYWVEARLWVYKNDVEETKREAAK